jgi:hypothetical protein
MVSALIFSVFAHSIFDDFKSILFALMWSARVVNEEG